MDTYTAVIYIKDQNAPITLKGTKEELTTTYCMMKNNGLATDGILINEVGQRKDLDI
jgi:pectin methylesterase-like acyl-CoA thioesterase